MRTQMSWSAADDRNSTKTDFANADLVWSFGSALGAKIPRVGKSIIANTETA